MFAGSEACERDLFSSYERQYFTLEICILPVGVRGICFPYEEKALRKFRNLSFGTDSKHSLV